MTLDPMKLVERARRELARSDGRYALARRLRAFNHVLLRTEEERDVAIAQREALLTAIRPLLVDALSQSQGSEVGHLREDVERARAAIAKAEGRS